MSAFKDENMYLVPDYCYWNIPLPKKNSMLDFRIILVLTRELEFMCRQQILQQNNGQQLISLGSSLLIQSTQIPSPEKESMHCIVSCFRVNWALSAWSTSGLHLSPTLWFGAKYFHPLCLSYFILQMGLFGVSRLQSGWDGEIRKCM